MIRLTPILSALRFLLAMLFLLSIMQQVFCQISSFQKINSGTKADIKSIMLDNRKGVYFLTDKIYKLNQDRWEKLDFPVEGKIYGFYPVTPQDLWFTVIPFTSTCMLYHFHDGITENLRPPFVNYITAMHFISENSALVASIADIAVYENSSFRMLPTSPAQYNILKIYGADPSDFWIMTEGAELYHYKEGKYSQVFKNKIVTCFCFNNLMNGYIVVNDELYKVEGSELKLMIKNPLLSNVNNMFLSEDHSLMMAGDMGLLASYVKGRLLIIQSQCAENLTDIVSSGSDTWVCGKNGRLLYAGMKQFPVYAEVSGGFSSHKLSSVGLNADGEYGVAMADFNGDQVNDIYTVRLYEQNRLYINNIVSSDMVPNIQGFTEEVVKRNANGEINPEKSPAQNDLKLGVCAADIDNDGDQDLYLCSLNTLNKLLLNGGDGVFRNVSAQKNRACENMERSNAAVFADVDNDGDLDMFVTSEKSSNRLFENNGTGHFTDITGSSGLLSTGGGMCASFADVNNDGYPDLCASFWYPSNKLYLNESKNGSIHFRDITSLSDLAAATPSKSNAVCFADVNNDGFTDLFIASRNNGNKLYLNDGNGVFSDRTSVYFQPESTMSNGAVFADFDLDGYQDLYVTNVGENVLYKNMGGRYFKDMTAVFGAELSGYCTGCATGDVDNDGDADLYVANYINGNSTLFLNITDRKSFVKFLLHGVRSNKDAIGAKVWLYNVAGDHQPDVLAGYRELNGGGGYASVSAKEMIFGVAQDVKYYALIKFPSLPDTIRINDIVAGMTQDVNELNGLPEIFTESRISVARFFTDQEKQPEIIKFVLIIMLLVFYNVRLRKSPGNIILTRWLATGSIFLVFIAVNQFFLFQWYSLSFFIAPLIVFGLIAIEHLFIDRTLLRRMAQKERQELREKLSRDLHDDLASTLGSISIYAETFKDMNDPSPSDFKKLSVKIAALTQSALHSISDIIWMTSPRNDSLQSLVSKTSDYMLEVLTDNWINFESDIEIPDDPVVLQEKIRNDAFLIMKEGLHNIIRHSGAKNVAFHAQLTENRCKISLKDDGMGIEASKGLAKGSHGNGLVNMRKRAQESGMEIIINSGTARGTEIMLQFKI